MNILISGKNGQLGKAICMRLKTKNINFTAVDIEQLDITDYKAVDEFIKENKPNVIINCSAFTNVDACEDENKFESIFKVNAHGARNLSIAANNIGAKIVYISTDYVFDGNFQEPIREFNHINPINKYGLSKEYGERLVRETNQKHFILRTAWLYGDGKNFVRTMLDIAKKQNCIDVVNDQIGTPTSTVDLTNCILDLIDTDLYGTYHATNEGFCSWYDLAKKIFELKNLNVTVNQISSEKLNRKAKRPRYSILENFMLNVVGKNCFRRWEDSLREYLDKE